MNVEDDTPHRGRRPASALASEDGFVTAEALAEMFAEEMERDTRLRELAASPGVEHHLGEAAREVGRIRRGAEPGSSLEHLADRLAGHIESLWLILAASAVDYIAAGLGVEQALDRVDRAVEELCSRMGAGRER